MGTKGNVPDYYSWDKVVNGNTTHITNYATTEVINDAIRLVNLPVEPFFMVVSLHSIHYPLHAPPENLHTYTLPPNVDDDPIAHANAMLEAADTEIGRFLWALPNDTYIILVGDNGTSKNIVEPPFQPDRAKGTVYEGGVNVPFIVTGPGILKQTSQELITLADVYATVLGLANTTSTAEDSVSVKPILFSGSSLNRDKVYTERFRPNNQTTQFKVRRRAARNDRYKLVLVQGHADELYDLSVDPFEYINIIDGPIVDPTIQAIYDNLLNYINTIYN
jgi:arylsulfatase A-like enzyme